MRSKHFIEKEFSAYVLKCMIHCTTIISSYHGCDEEISSLGRWNKWVSQCHTLGTSAIRYPPPFFIAWLWWGNQHRNVSPLKLKDGTCWFVLSFSLSSCIQVAYMTIYKLRFWLTWVNWMELHLVKACLHFTSIYYSCNEWNSLIFRMICCFV